MQLKSFDEAAGYLPDVCFKTPPDLGVLLGSGWGDALKIDEIAVRIKYADIPGLGASTVKGHSGELICTAVWASSSPRGADVATSMRAQDGNPSCCQLRFSGGWVARNCC